jgi:hypothetical protein
MFSLPNSLTIIDGEFGSKLTVTKQPTLKLDQTVLELRLLLENDLKKPNLVLVLNSGLDLNDKTVLSSLQLSNCSLFVYSKNSTNQQVFPRRQIESSKETNQIPSNHVYYTFSLRFFDHYKKQSDILLNVQKFKTLSDKMIQETVNQVESIRILDSLTQKFSDSHSTKFNKFLDRVSPAITKYKSYKSSLADDITKLTQAKLSLSSPDKPFLSDYLLPEKQLTDLSIKYQTDIDKFIVLHDEVKSCFDQLVSVENVKKVDFIQTTNFVKSVEKLLEEATTCCDSSRNAYTNVCKQLNVPIGKDSIHIQDHDHTLTNIIEFTNKCNLEKQLSILEEELTRLKLDYNEKVKRHIQHVERMQNLIVGVKKFGRLDLAFTNNVSSKFSTLELIHKMHNAYLLTTFEISRRNAFAQHFEKLVQEFYSKLTQVREGEMRMRSVFNKNVSVYIPVGLFDGLGEDPTGFELHCNDDKNSLPALSLGDILDQELIREFVVEQQDLDVYGKNILLTESLMEESSLDSSFHSIRGESLKDVCDMLIQHVRHNQPTVERIVEVLPSPSASPSPVVSIVNDEIEKLKAQLMEKDRIISEMEKKHTKATRSLSDEIADLHKVADEMDKQISKVTEEKTTLKLKCEGAEGELNTQIKMYKELNEKYRLLEMQKEHVEEALRDKERDFTTLETEFHKIQQELQDLNKKSSESQESTDTMITIQKLRLELEENKKKLVTQESVELKLRADIQQLGKLIDDCTTGLFGVLNLFVQYCKHNKNKTGISELEDQLWKIFEDPPPPAFDNALIEKIARVIFGMEPEN